MAANGGKRPRNQRFAAFSLAPLCARPAAAALRPPCRVARHSRGRIPCAQAAPRHRPATGGKLRSLGPGVAQGLEQRLACRCRDIAASSAKVRCVISLMASSLAKFRQLPTKATSASVSATSSASSMLFGRISPAARGRSRRRTRPGIELDFQAQHVGDLAAQRRQRPAPGAVDRQIEFGAQAARGIVDGLEQRADRDAATAAQIVAQVRRPGVRVRTSTMVTDTP